MGEGGCIGICVSDRPGKASPVRKGGCMHGPCGEGVSPRGYVGGPYPALPPPPPWPLRPSLSSWPSKGELVHVSDNLPSASCGAQRGGQGSCGRERGSGVGLPCPRLPPSPPMWRSLASEKKTLGESSLALLIWKWGKLRRRGRGARERRALFFVQSATPFGDGRAKNTKMSRAWL